MANKPSNVPLYIAGIAAVGALGLLGVIQSNSNPEIQEKKEKEAERKQRDATAKNPSATPAQAMGAPGANDVATWGAETTLGDPKGDPAVTVAWEWTPAVQGNPASINDAVQAAKIAFPKAAIHVINLDAKPGAAKPGISVAGVVKAAPSADGTFPPLSSLMGQLRAPGK